jgi:DNA repair photolyase
MSRFGITERGDAGRNLSWVDKMGTVDMAVLITKTPTPEFLEAAKQFKDKAIIHLTCTGWGGTAIEPNVFAPKEVLKAGKVLRAAGFDLDQIVLRLDPIILTENWTGWREARVLEMFQEVTQRCRFSFLDMYPHVKERFRAAGFKLPHDSFEAPRDWRYKAFKVLDRFNYSYELCAETVLEKSRWADWEHDFTEAGCISEFDPYVLGMNNLDVGGSSGQRRGCLCPAGKTELLDWSKCPNGCLYCYWKHN